MSGSEISQQNLKNQLKTIHMMLKPGETAQARLWDTRDSFTRSVVIFTGRLSVGYWTFVIL